MQTTETNIKDLIYEIRGRQVMLDSDVARLYQYETKYMNLTVKRNIERFPEEFCFQLTEEEYQNCSRLQIATLNKSGNKRGSNKKYLPYVFTEPGIAMLSALLKNDVAIAVSIKIMNAFVEMRRILLNNTDVYEKIEQHELKLIEHDNKFDMILSEFNLARDIKQKIFYNGQIWDAYKIIVDIFKTADEDIIIVDNYIDDTLLDLISKKKKSVLVTIITNKENNKLTNLDISKFNK